MTRLTKKNFKDRVYEIVKKVPKGKVTTYGEVAQVLGKVRWARQVGWALHQNKQSLRSSSFDKLRTAGLKDSNVPCHRVVDRNGRLAPNFAFNGAKEQRRRLEVEGVEFVDRAHVDLEKCLWQG